MGFIFAVIIMFSFYTGTNIYIAKKAFQWITLFIPGLSGKIFIAVYVFFALSMFLGFSPIPTDIKRIINWIGSHWMGIYLYLLMLIPLADIILLLGRLLKIVPKPVPKNIHFYSGLIVILLITGLVIYGKHNANQISQVSYDIQTGKKSFSKDTKIVLISDLHLGAVNSENTLLRIVQGVNNLEPDIVCLAGDIFNDDINILHNPSGVMDSFKSIKTKYGVYACLGNHDGGKTFNEMTEFLSKSNIKLLNDEFVIIDNRLALIGRVDPSPIGGFGGLERKDISDVLSSIDLNLPIVVMDHNPSNSNLNQYGDNIDLILSGHTHKGQIFPANLITKAIYTVDYGHYRKDAHSPHIIVTSGAGTWAMPMRIGTNNEIASITVRPDSD